MCVSGVCVCVKMVLNHKCHSNKCSKFTIPPPSLFLEGSQLCMHAHIMSEMYAVSFTIDYKRTLLRAYPLLTVLSSTHGCVGASRLATLALAAICKRAESRSSCALMSSNMTVYYLFGFFKQK